MSNLLNEIQKATDAGWIKNKPKRKSAAELGIKHATRIATRRAITSAVPGLLGSILSLVATQALNKKL